MHVKSEFEGSYSKIESIATQIRYIIDERSTADLGESAETRQKLDWLTKRLGGQILFSQSPLGEEESHGSLVIHANNSFSIYLPSLSPPLRDNFTLAHELGHYFLHHNQEESHDGNIVFNRYGSDKREIQANRFAAAFLMPEKEFTEKYKEYEGNKWRLSGYFSVSPLSVDVRMKFLNL